MNVDSIRSSLFFLHAIHRRWIVRFKKKMLFFPVVGNSRPLKNRTFSFVSWVCVLLVFIFLLFCRSSFSVLQFGWTTYASLQSASTANYINSTRIECEHQLVVCRRWFVSPWNSGAKTHIEKKKNDKANKSSLLIAARPAPGDEYSSCTWFSLYFKVGF